MGTLSKEKRKALDGVIKEINTKYKTNIDYASNQMEHLKVKFLKTPSRQINNMLGGGFARGRIIELYGAESSGKTCLAMETIAYNQKLD